MSDERPDFHFAATGIGSVPFLDIIGTCKRILSLCPKIPFWPQFVRRCRLEDMHLQASENLPLLQLLDGKRGLRISQGQEREAALVTFYDHFMAEDTDYFAVSYAYAPGLYTLLDLIQREPNASESYLKGQAVGPITFLLGIPGLDGKPILHDHELKEAMAHGLAAKALWQIRKLESSGRKPVFFLDEPALSGFGSAFSAIQRHEVVDLLRVVIDYLRGHSDALLGIHCCGNTDWSMIVETGPDIISFDASDYLDYFLLYEKEIQRFLFKGGIIAWGIVPTANFRGTETAEGLLARLREGFTRIKRWGIDLELLCKSSIITPACGMGTMSPQAAEKALLLLSKLPQDSLEMLL